MKRAPFCKVRTETSLKLLLLCWSPLTSPVVFQVGENFVPPLLDAVLIDYQRNVPAAREPEVLSTMATIVNKLGGHITSEIPQIFDAVFECTLNMINKVRRLPDSDAGCMISVYLKQHHGHEADWNTGAQQVTKQLSHRVNKDFN